MKNLIAVFIFSLAAVALPQVVHDPNFILSVELTGLRNPTGVTVDLMGNVYVSDSGHGRVLKGRDGSYSEWVGGFGLDGFGGIEFGPLSVLVTPWDTVLVGRGDLPTGQELISEYDFDGNLLGHIGPHSQGGNYFGLTLDPAGNLYAASSNRDVLLKVSRSGGTWGSLQVLSETWRDGFVSPTGILYRDGVLYTAIFGSVGAPSDLVSYDATTGALIDSSVFHSDTGLSSVADFSYGAYSMLVGEYGNFFKNSGGRVWLLDPDSGNSELLVDDFALCTSVFGAPDGSIYFIDMGTPNNANGRLLKLTQIPEPSSLLGLSTLLVFGFRKFRKR